MCRFIVPALLLASAASAAEPAGRKLPVPTDIAAVPADCAAFVRVNLADLWKNPALKEVRALLELAGPKALQAFDKRFTPTPSTVLRMTAYMPIPDFNQDGLPKVVAVFTVGTPFDRDQCLKQFGDKMRLRKGKAGGFYTDENGAVAVRFIDDTTFALGTEESIQHMVDHPPSTKAGPLTAALELAVGDRPVVIGANLTAIPAEGLAELMQQVPEPIRPLLKAQSLVLSMDLVGDGHLHAQAVYADGKAADAAEKAVEFASKMAVDLIGQTRSQLAEKVFGDGKSAKIEDLPEAAASLLGLGALQQAEDILKTKPIKRAGDTLTATVPLPPYFKTLLGSAAMSGPLFAPAIGKIREAGNRIQSANNLKQIGLATISYADSNQGIMPAAAIVDKKGKPLLSWRVTILPFLGEDDLYKQFKLDEPWDSDHNKTLIKKMPKMYVLPGGKDEPGTTHYRVFVGDHTAFHPIQGVLFPASFQDGTSNTLLAFDAADAVVWSKPDDVEFNPKKPVKPFFRFTEGGTMILLADGSVRTLSPKISEETLINVISRDDGNVLGSDF